MLNSWWDALATFPWSSHYFVAIWIYQTWTLSNSYDEIHLLSFSQTKFYIMTWISNYISSFVEDVISQSCHNCNTCLAIEVFDELINPMDLCVCNYLNSPGIMLCMHPANRRRYNVTSCLIGWAHTQNDPCSHDIFYHCIKRLLWCSINGRGKTWIPFYFQLGM